MEEYEDEHLGRRITAGPVIFAIAAVLILSATGFYFFYGRGEVEDVKAIFREQYYDGDNIEGVQFGVYITPAGPRSYSGTGTIDVFYDGKLELSKSIEVDADDENMRLSYREFVVGNGDYDIKCTVAGKSGNFTHYVYHLPDAVIAKLEVVGQDYDQSLQLTLAPTYDINLTEYVQITDINKNYRYTYKITDEEGGEVSGNYLSYEMDPNNNQISRQIDLDIMGNYTVEASLETLLMKEGVGSGTVTRGPYVKHINMMPVLEVSASATTVKPGTEVTFSLKGSDIDSNGEVKYYYLELPDADGDELKEYVTYDYDGPTTRVKYTFEELGKFNVTFTAADNGPVIGSGENIQILQEYSL